MSDRIPHGTNMHEFMEAPVAKPRMKTASAKAKGRGLQQKVAAALLAAFPSLSPDDIRSTSMGAGGEDVQLSMAARNLIPVTIECKKHKAFSVYTIYDQATRHRHAPVEPLVVIEADRRKPLAIVDFAYFVDLLAFRAGKNNA